MNVAGGNLSVTYSRMRPETVNPSIYIGSGNDQRFLNEQDRIATQYVRAGGTWVSETRFGWNRNSLDRLNDFWMQINPAVTGDVELTDPGPRIAEFTIAGAFATPLAEVLAMRGRSYSAEQKFSRFIGSHNFKAGFRWSREGGSKTNPAEPELQLPDDPRPAGEPPQLHESAVGTAAARCPHRQLRRVPAGRLARHPAARAQPWCPLRLLPRLSCESDERSRRRRSSTSNRQPISTRWISVRRGRPTTSTTPTCSTSVRAPASRGRSTKGERPWCVAGPACYSARSCSR